MQREKTKRILRKTIKVLLFVSGGIILLTGGLIVYITIVAQVDPPVPPHAENRKLERREVSEGFYTLGNNWLRKSESGLYELYLEGEPYDRGIAAGMLSKELIQYQETVFTDQIHVLVPSESFLGILRYFVGWFNRNLDEEVPGESKLEILGISESASHDFDNIAPAYQRLLNYHAAHDIGHALQNMSLVGCTSFATWGSKSENHSLIIGRNFDFYVGDKFAENKIIAFYNPSRGYRFMMITWGGMTGVVSGMNSEGLTVTLNAAKSDIVYGAATPVSIVAREILQYASTIDEAYAIAQKRKMFVAESFLIGSAHDKRAAIIEKSSSAQELYQSDADYIICTNHFQGKITGNTPVNLEHIRTSASFYRYQRVEELLQQNGQNSLEKTAGILRDQRGIHDKDIGMGNEKSINQLIAHHSLIFEPEKQLAWISTDPWQLGKYVCYDLNKVFSTQLTSDHEIYDSSLTIAPDTFINTAAYLAYLKFHPFRFPFMNVNKDVQPDSLTIWNPNSYLAYMLAGDREYKAKQYARASGFYEVALTKEIASEQEKNYIEKQIRICKEKQ